MIENTPPRPSLPVTGRGGAPDIRICVRPGQSRKNPAACRNMCADLSAANIRCPGSFRYDETNEMRLRNLRRTRRLGLALLAIACACFVAQARFRQPSEEYAARRAKLRASADGPIVIFGYTGHEDASEVAVFFQEPYFYYLTGHDEPGAAVVILPKQSQPGIPNYVGPPAILYLPARDPAQEKWKGPKIGPDDPDVAQR